jgi:hypothetical protein
MRRSEGKVAITAEQSLFKAGVSPMVGQLHEEGYAKRLTINIKSAEKTRLAVNLAVPPDLIV